MITHHYNHFEEAKRTAAAKRDAAVREFSWLKASQKLAAAVPEGHLLADRKFVPIDCKVEFEVNRATEASVNLRQYRFMPGVKYVESEGVFEVLWHAGYIKKG
jgi:hypothetical protein